MKCSGKDGQSVQHQPHRERNTHKHTHTEVSAVVCVCVCVQSQLNKSTEAMKKCRCFFLILIGLLCIANRLYKEMLQQRDILLLLLLLPRATQTWQYILIKPSKEEEGGKKRNVPRPRHLVNAVWQTQCKRSKQSEEENSSDCALCVFLLPLSRSLFPLPPPLSPSLSLLSLSSFPLLFLLPLPYIPP